MKVAELIAELSKLNPDADVLFDTEAQTYQVHLVSVDSVEDISAEEIGREVVCLFEHAPHRVDRRDLIISDLEAQIFSVGAARDKAEVECLRLRHVIAGFNPRVDAADFDQLAEVGLSIEESRKRMGEIQTRLAKSES